MKLISIFCIILSITTIASAASAGGCGSCTATPAAAAKTYALRGVIVDVLPGQSGLLVRHEDIPGFMPAMTMLFKVDEATLQVATKGQAITATLVPRDGDYWLTDVKPAPAKP